MKKKRKKKTSHSQGVMLLLSFVLEEDREEAEPAVPGGVLYAFLARSSARLTAALSGLGPPAVLMACLGICPIGACILACASGSSGAMPRFWNSCFRSCLKSCADGSPVPNHSLTCDSQRGFSSFLFDVLLPVLGVRVLSLLLTDGLYSEPHSPPNWPATLPRAGSTEPGVSSLIVIAPGARR